MELFKNPEYSTDLDNIGLDNMWRAFVNKYKKAVDSAIKSISEQEIEENITSFRAALTKNDNQEMYRGYIDIPKIKEYIDTQMDYTRYPDGSLGLPNGTHIPTKDTSNTLTKQTFGDHAKLHKEIFPDGTPTVSQGVLPHHLQEIFQANGGMLEVDDYHALLGGTQETHNLLIEENFPEIWNMREKMTGLLYVASQLYGNNHINGKEFELLELTGDVENRGYREKEDTWQQDILSNIIRVKKS